MPQVLKSAAQACREPLDSKNKKAPIKRRGFLESTVEQSNKDYFVGTVVVVDSAVAAPAAAPVSVPAAAGTVVVVVSAGAVVVSFLVQAAAATATKAINAKFLKFIGSPYGVGQIKY